MIPMASRGYINLVKQHPEISWFDARSMREISMHTLATDIIEAADDGKTVPGFVPDPRRAGVCAERQPSLPWPDPVGALWF